MIWYGLTRDEACRLCRERSLSCRFLDTLDPRGDRAAGTPRVIRAREEDGGMTFLLGYFAPTSHELRREE